MEPTPPGQEGQQRLATGLQDTLDGIRQLMLLRGGDDEEQFVPKDRPVVEDAVGLHDLSLDDDPITYAPRLFAQLALPYQNPGDVPKWRRTNGAITLTIRPGEWHDQFVLSGTC